MIYKYGVFLSWEDIAFDDVRGCPGIVSAGLIIKSGNVVNAKKLTIVAEEMLTCQMGTGQRRWG